eukprot:Transcript_8671.p1 GENE.Transcript_8671~~Transcript_8671.p1  ORF type:complete len:514 (+),score=170.38 Transcript_8671:804-2345(+)
MARRRATRGARHAAHGRLVHARGGAAAERAQGQGDARARRAREQEPRLPPSAAAGRAADDARRQQRVEGLPRGAEAVGRRPGGGAAGAAGGMQKNTQAATHIKAAYRGLEARRQLQLHRNAARKIQRQAHERSAVRDEYRVMMAGQAASEIQSKFRGAVKRKGFQRMRKAALTIQRKINARNLRRRGLIADLHIFVKSGRALPRAADAGPSLAPQLERSASSRSLQWEGDEFWHEGDDVENLGSLGRPPRWSLAAVPALGEESELELGSAAREEKAKHPVNETMPKELAIAMLEDPETHGWFRGHCNADGSATKAQLFDWALEKLKLLCQAAGEPEHPTKNAMSARRFVSALLSREPIEFNKFRWSDIRDLLNALVAAGPATLGQQRRERSAESTLVPEAAAIKEAVINRRRTQQRIRQKEEQASARQAAALAKAVASGEAAAAAKAAASGEAAAPGAAPPPPQAVTVGGVKLGGAPRRAPAPPVDEAPLKPERKRSSRGARAAVRFADQLGE